MKLTLHLKQYLPNKPQKTKFAIILTYLLFNNKLPNNRNSKIRAHPILSKPNTMNEQLDTQIAIQHLRVLQLFPIRAPTSQLDINLEKYKKFYEELCCIFCKQIYNNPIFLKCSHRFCRDCIQTYIRLNQKIQCPLCQYEIINNKDFKQDKKLITLINSLFTNILNFKSQLNTYETNIYQSIIKSRQQQQKQSKRQRTDLFQIKYKTIEPPCRKKYRKSGGETMEQSKSKNNKKEKGKGKLSIEEEKKIMESLTEEQHNFVQQQLKSFNFKNIKTTKPKKNKYEIIQIDSEDQQTIKNTNKIQIDSNNTINKQNIVIQQQLRENRVSLPSQPTKQKQTLQLDHLSHQKPNSTPPQNQQHKKKSQLQLLHQHKIESSLIAARQKLKTKLKQSYLSNIILKSQIQCSVFITLRRRPKFSVSPTLDISTVKISLYANLALIKKFILCKCKIPQNCNNNIVTIYVLSHERKIWKLNDDTLNIFYILQNYWKQYKGLLKETIQESIQEKGENKINSGENARILYYVINLKQIDNRVNTTSNQNK